ncbi:hypothetical protein HYG86_13365 [Alkalicella caledoniensis]|uniref:Transglutaminase superfamily protein n=1 Tax=Alkalicella caledoniensis TaxID=2731377 RepID=A0A7G9WAI3_ALKCA|nr:hypothetical protein [Alkalicella caledoniensis]QNO15695.1 hypothetical protein HYG86_13365 [Alkalicella caledoniensis]
MKKCIVCIIILVLLFSQTVLAEVLIDNHHKNYNTIKWEEIFEEFDTPPWFPIDIKVLENYSVYIIEKPTFDILSTEKREIKKFIEQGGTVLLLTEYEDLQKMNNYGSLVEELGFSFIPKIFIDTPDYDSPKRFYNHFSTPLVTGSREFDLTVRNIYPLQQSEKYTETYKAKGSYTGFSLVDNVLQDSEEFHNPILGAKISHGEGNLILLSGMYRYDLEFTGAITSILDTHLRGNTKNKQFSELLLLQAAIEDIYWEQNTSQLGYALEDAWKAYYTGDHVSVNQLIDSMEELFEVDNNYSVRSIYALLLGVVYLTLLLTAKKTKIHHKYILIIGVISIGWLTSYNILRAVNSFHRWQFILQFLSLGGLFALATFRRRNLIDWGKKVILISLFLLYWYSASLPNHITIDRYFLNKPLIDPESVPIQLLIEEFRERDLEGAQLAREVDAFVNRIITYREEDIDLHMTPIETLKYKEEDCDGIAIVIASILDGLGMDAYVAINSVHAWVQVDLDNGESIGLSTPYTTYFYSQDKNGFREVKIYNYINAYLTKFYTNAIINSMIIAYFPNVLSWKLALDYSIIVVIGILIVSLSKFLAQINSTYVLSIFIFYLLSVRMISTLKYTHIKKEIAILKAVITVSTFLTLIVAIPILTLFTMDNLNDFHLFFAVVTLLILYIGVISTFRRGLKYQINILFRIFVKKEEIDYNKEQEQITFFEEL